jgi:hypothetical protein
MRVCTGGWETGEDDKTVDENTDSGFAGGYFNFEVVIHVHSICYRSEAFLYGKSVWIVVYGQGNRIH